MKRDLFNLLAVVSLPLCVAAVGLWVRGDTGQVVKRRLFNLLAGISLLLCVALLQSFCCLCYVERATASSDIMIDSWHGALYIDYFPFHRTRNLVVGWHAGCQLSDGFPFESPAPLPPYWTPTVWSFNYCIPALVCVIASLGLWRAARREFPPERRGFEVVAAEPAQSDTE